MDTTLTFANAPSSKQMMSSDAAPVHSMAPHSMHFYPQEPSPFPQPPYAPPYQHPLYPQQAQAPHSSPYQQHMHAHKRVMGREMRFGYPA